MKGPLIAMSIAAALCAPLVASAAVILEQPDFSQFEQIVGDTPQFFSGASQRTPSLESLFTATGTVRRATVRFDMLDWPTADHQMQAYLYECPLAPDPNLSQCRRVVAKDTALGWEESGVIHPANWDPEGGEFSIDFTHATSFGFQGPDYEDGVPLYPNRGYRLEIVFQPNSYTSKIFGAYSTTTGGFNPFFRLEGDVPTSTPATTTPKSIDPMIVIPGILGSQQKNGVWVIDPILHAYDDLIETLESNGYTSNVNLFTFAYDWRNKNADTALLLKIKIDEVKSICHCDKVDLVAHSMGGLVARQYAQSSEYQSDIDQIIFLGTPHLGAPKAYLMWEGGEFGAGTDLQSLLVEYGLGLEAHEKGYDDLFSYVTNAPITSVKELLPIYSYVFDGSNLRHYPDRYPVNPFLETLKSSADMLDTVGIHVTNIIGDTGDAKTIVGLNVVPSTSLPKWSDGYPAGFSNLIGDHGFVLGAGDGTVPMASATGIKPSDLTLNACHLSLPSFAKNKIVETLTGVSVSTSTPAVDVCNAKVAVFQIFSPADIVVVAPDGRHVGKNFNTGGEYNEIPGAFYSGSSSSEEFVTILNPIDGDYKFLTQGVGAGGHYTVKVVYNSGATSSVKSFSGITTTGLVTEHIVNISPTIVDVTPGDKNAPRITIGGISTSTYLHSSFAPVIVDISDSTGIASSTVQFDSKTISASTTIDLFFEALGEHMISVRAVDYVGNSATSAKRITVVATVDSTKNDVARVFTNGWIKKDLRDLILLQLNQSLILQKVSSSSKNGSKTTILVQVVDKALMQLILKELQIGRTVGAVNAQGYEILSKDIIWIIGHN